MIAVFSFLSFEEFFTVSNARNIALAELENVEAAIGATVEEFVAWIGDIPTPEGDHGRHRATD